MMLAQRANCPELAIGMDEGAAFMAAAQNVLRHYSVQTTQKTLDWVAFAGIAGGMYLTRGVAISNRLAAERAERGDFGKGQAGGVLQFRRRPQPVEVSASGQEGPSQPGGAPAAPIDLASFTPGLGGFAEAEPA